MSTKIRGDRDIQPGTIYNEQIAGTAAIAWEKLGLASAAGSLVSPGVDQIPVFRPLLAADIPQIAYSSLSGLPTLGSSAALNVGTAPGTVAAGDHLHTGVYEPAFATLPWSRVDSTPTTLAGYGITDPIVLTSGSYADPAWISSLAWGKLTGTPTTLAGYGITDAQPLNAKLTALAALANGAGLLRNNGAGVLSWSGVDNGDITSIAWGKITGTPTTLAGYGITSPLPVAQGGTGTATVFTSGSVVFAGASGVYSQNAASLFWDAANTRLGIGTNAPARLFNVNGVSLFGSANSAWVPGSWAGLAMQLDCSSSSNGLVVGQSTSEAGIFGWQQGSGNQAYLLIDTFSGGRNISIGKSGNCKVGFGSVTVPLSRIHIAPGSATANTAPLQFSSGALEATARAGVMEFLTDDYFLTITTGAARKGIVLDDGARLTSGNYPKATTNGRLIDSIMTEAAGVVTIGGTLTVPGVGTNSERFGAGSTAAGNNTVAMGFGATASGSNAVAIGYTASGSLNSVAIGFGALATGQRSVLIGTNTIDNGGSFAVAIGFGASAETSSTSLGNGAISANSGVAVGQGAQVAIQSIAIGHEAQAAISGNGGIALGRRAITTAQEQFVVGSSSNAVVDAYLGNGVTVAAPRDITVNASGGSGTDVSGAHFIIAGGRPTGSGVGGSIIIKTASAGATGATLRSLVEQMRIDQVGHVGIGTAAPTALLHLKAGTATANTAPLKLTSGTVLTTAEAGAIEFTTDDFFGTITTGAARKGFVLDDGARLTSGKYPKATTNGRLIDGPTPLAGTKVYYVSDTLAGPATRQLTFTDGILTAET